MLNTKTVTFLTEQDQTQLAIDALFGDEVFLVDDQTDNRSAPMPSLGATCYACQPMPSTVHEDIREFSPSCWRFSPRSLVVGLLLLLAGYFGSLAIRSPMETETAQPANTAPGVVVDGVRYRPIETYRPCDRVLGHNPELTDTDRADFGPEPDPRTWKLLTLHAPKHDGSTAEVQMVEGPEWLAEHRPEVGATVPIAVPECGIGGMAEVLSIGPCPPVKPGKNPVVLATFKHYVGSTVDVYVTGLSEPIGYTGNHPFWSEDRQQFIRADELRPGENLDGLGPGACVERVVTVKEPQHVYNIQVQGEHVYRVSKSGLLVHNGSNVCKIAPEGGIFKKLRITPGKGFDPSVPSAPGGKSFITYVFTDAHDDVVYVGRASGTGSPSQVLRSRIAKGHEHFLKSLKPHIAAVHKSKLASQGAEEVFIQGYREHGAILTNVDNALSYGNTQRSQQSILKLEAYFEELFAR